MDCNHSQDVSRRLARIGGQVNGIREMVEQGRTCEDILVQMSSVSSALTQAARLIMTNHLEHCVIEGIENGNKEQTIASLKKAVEQFAKMK